MRCSARRASTSRRRSRSPAAGAITSSTIRCSASPASAAIRCLSRMRRTIDVPPNAVGSTRTGVAQCFTVSGDYAARVAARRDRHDADPRRRASTARPASTSASSRTARSSRSRARTTAGPTASTRTWKPHDDLMFYATWSKGFRPGGINRQPGLAAYDPDFLINYELGWKTTFGPVRWNGAIYHQMWKKFQFSFLGENSLTVVQNGRDARINGIETDVSYTAGGLTLNAAAAYTDAKTKENICDVAADPTPNCDLILVEDDPLTPEDETEIDYIVAPKGTRCRSLRSSSSRPPRATPGTWGRAGRMSRPAWFTRARRALGAAGTADQAVTGNAAAPTLWSTCSPATTGASTASSCSRRTSSTSATNCRAVCRLRRQLHQQIHIVPGRPRTIGLRAGDEVLGVASRGAQRPRPVRFGVERSMLDAADHCRLQSRSLPRCGWRCCCSAPATGRPRVLLGELYAARSSRGCALAAHGRDAVRQLAGGGRAQPDRRRGWLLYRGQASGPALVLLVGELARPRLLVDPREGRDLPRCVRTRSICAWSRCTTCPSRAAMRPIR